MMMSSIYYIIKKSKILKERNKKNDKYLFHKNEEIEGLMEGAEK